MKINRRAGNVFSTCVVSLIVFLLSFHPGCSPLESNGKRNTMESDDILEYYSTQSPFTNPGKYEYLYDGIPSDVDQIVNVVQGLLLHLAQVEIVELPIPHRRIRNEIHLKSVERMLKCLSRMDDRPISFSRPFDKRVVGICAHFVLLTCSILRHKGIPARSRGGFETYHSATAHHDHWICEYWNSSEDRWVKIDPELNDFLKKQWKVTFDNIDLPPGVFRTGAETWTLCRRGEQNPDHYGIKGDKWFGGWDFVLNAAVLDFLALNKVELLPWDGIKLSEKGMKSLDEEEFALLDEASQLVVAGDESFVDMRALFKNHKKFQK